eukprot:COSAG06_NODE_3432_length_5355_cov_9.890982_3_plen_97_part_00
MTTARQKVDEDCMRLHGRRMGRLCGATPPLLLGGSLVWCIATSSSWCRSRSRSHNRSNRSNQRSRQRSRRRSRRHFLPFLDIAHYKLHLLLLLNYF